MKKQKKKKSPGKTIVKKSDRDKTIEIVMKFLARRIVRAILASI